MLCTPRRILLILLSSLALGYIISHLHSNSHRSSKQLKAKRDVLLPTHIYSSKGVVNGNEEERLYEEIQKEFENDGVRLYQRSKNELCPANTAGIQNQRECELAASGLGLLDTTATELVSSVLPSGCFYKAGKIATYYQNYYNHSAIYLNMTEQRLFYNSDVHKNKILKQNEKWPVRRQAVCRSVAGCAKDMQGLTCSHWLASAPGLHKSCKELQEMGLNCAGCVECKGESNPVLKSDDDCNGPRGRNPNCKKGGLYSAAANSASTPNLKKLRVVCLGGIMASKLKDMQPIPPGHVLVYIGGLGQGNEIPSLSARRKDVIRFNSWLGKLPHRTKYVLLSQPWRNLRIQGLPILTNAQEIYEVIEGVDVDGDGEPEISVWGGRDTQSVPDNIDIIASLSTPSHARKGHARLHTYSDSKEGNTLKPQTPYLAPLKADTLFVNVNMEKNKMLPVVVELEVKY
eukprot:m.239210 g.239210  ORF g.239210 m.239210 type:complete len:459 (+) comp16064_c0_seq1:279-1655(+)